MASSMLARLPRSTVMVYVETREGTRQELMVPEPFRDARILMVDDERSMVRLLEELLAHAGYQRLRSTTDARQVPQLCAEFQPDLILLDLRMPILDGLPRHKGLQSQR